MIKFLLKFPVYYAVILYFNYVWEVDLSRSFWHFISFVLVLGVFPVLLQIIDQEIK